MNKIYLKQDYSMINSFEIRTFRLKPEKVFIILNIFIIFQISLFFVDPLIHTLPFNLA